MKNPSPPNILFILIDDLGWRDLGCYGSTFYETPHLDRLASEGILFTNAYAACPVCSPTRASILSGKYPAVTGVTDWIGAHTKGRLIDAPYRKELPLSETCIAVPLKERGYDTWHVGKWHLGEEPFYPEKHGFDVNLGGCEWGLPKNGYFSPYGIPTLEDRTDGEYLTDRLTDEAIALIEGQGNRPFFLNLWHYAVHIPIESKPEDIPKYETKRKAMNLDNTKEFEEGEYFPCDHKKHLHVTRRLIQSDPTYAAMIENLDFNIGRVLEALDRTGKKDNTMVIFTSDNGGLSSAEGSPTCNHPLNEGKGWMYEGGVREPLLIRWPKKIRPGRLCDTPITSPDFFPTLLDVSGSSFERKDLDGMTLFPLLQEDGEFPIRPIFWHYPHYGNQGGTPGSSVRFGDYKLIEFYEDSRLELYNLKNDPGETTDLSSQYPDVTENFHRMLLEWKDRIQAIIPEHNSEYPAS